MASGEGRPGRAEEHRGAGNNRPSPVAMAMKKPDPKRCECATYVIHLYIGCKGRWA